MGARADRWRAALILTVTRRCNLRCAYCPTVKDGVPDLSADDARRAIDLFRARYGGGDIKLFGGEPLLRPDIVEAVLTHVSDVSDVSVYLSTNGTRFEPAILDLLRAHPRVTLTLSIDGAARDHDGLRRPLPGEAPSFAAIERWLPELLGLPRFVVTQTIAPSTAARAAANFRSLRAMGIGRFNLLPGYYLPWSATQLAALEQSFSAIAADFEAAWNAGERLYLRNLFVSAPTPFFNTGFVVDADRTIHPSNLVLAEAVGPRTVVGTLDDPPSAEALAEAAARVPALLAEVYTPDVLASTAAVDRVLTRLCDRLYPAYFRARTARGTAAARVSGAA
ncbi:MAG: radical SAM protein [Pseudomonadota bacterium]|nr:radical SAM protein [Pseudomonadota bacterium]